MKDYPEFKLQNESVFSRISYWLLLFVGVLIGGYFLWWFLSFTLLFWDVVIPSPVHYL
jgi:uncharacterized membrane protein YoaK (UPF0700 family)